MDVTGSIKEMFTGSTEVTTLHGLFVEMLKDVYHAEKQILKALPKMAQNATSVELARTFETHRVETEGQVERLEKIFELIDVPARTKSCEAIQGLIAEAEETMDEAENEILDAGLVASGQAVEHYEIARYGTLKAWAKQMGMNEVARLLEQTLKEEEHANQLLTQLAERSINPRALAYASGMEDSDDESGNTTTPRSKTGSGGASRHH